MKSAVLVTAVAVCAAIGAAPTAAAVTAAPTTTPAASVTGVPIDPTSGLSTPAALNDRGEVIGIHAVGSELHGFAWQRGVLTDLGKLPGADFSRATAINARGDIVGWSGMFAADTETPVHAVLWRHGTITDLGTLGGDSSFATAVNNRDVVVGGSQFQPGNTQSRAFIWQRGVMTALPMLPGSQFSGPVAINERGEIAGFSIVAGTAHAVVWTAGRIVDLGPGRTVGLNQRGQVLVNAAPPFVWDRGRTIALPASTTAVAAINDRGQVAGTYVPAGGTARHGFLWDDGRITDLGTLGPVALNANGQVLAFSLTSSGLAFVWDRGQVTQLLPDSGDLALPTAINDRGLVIGSSGFDRAAVWQLPHH